MRTAKVEADRRAAEFIRDHGGRFLIWLSEAGIEHETTKPEAGIDFVELPADGLTLYVDPSIEPPHTWRLVFHRFPLPHVRALWNGGAWSPNSTRVQQWEGGSPLGTT